MIIAESVMIIEEREEAHEAGAAVDEEGASICRREGAIAWRGWRSRRDRTATINGGAASTVLALFEKARPRVLARRGAFCRQQVWLQVFEATTIRIDPGVGPLQLPHRIEAF